VKSFALDLTATQTAEMAGISQNTVNRFYAAFRHRIAAYDRPNDLNTGMVIKVMSLLQHPLELAYGFEHIHHLY